MSKDLGDKIRKDVAEHWRTAEGHALRLRLNLAEIIMRGLRRKGWTQRELGVKFGCKQPFISRILHGDANCTLKTVGKILHALDVKVKLVEVKKP